MWPWPCSWGLNDPRASAGPLLIRDHPEIFWGTVASMYIGNAMLLVLNLPSSGYG